METNENITLSLKDHLESKLTAMGFTKIFYIQDMRSVAGGTALPKDERYVFLTSNFVKPTITTLPFLVLEVSNFDNEPYELGNDCADARRFDVFIHIFGRSQSERNQIASYLQGKNGIGRSITYNDYSGSAPTAYGYPIQRISHITIDNVPPIRDIQVMEQSLANWNIVSFDARTISAD